MFNRGRTNPDLFPEVERLRGDRGDLSGIAGRTWDGVFDPSCYVPRLARLAAQTLRDAAPHYTFVSSLSVYADEVTPGQDETGRLAPIDDPSVEEITGETYGALKVLSEQEVQRVYGERALVLRPGYICGPYDGVDRMPYWLRRVERGGRPLKRPDLPFFDRRARHRRVRALLSAGGGVFNLCAELPVRPPARGSAVVGRRSRPGSRRVPARARAGRMEALPVGSPKRRGDLEEHVVRARRRRADPRASATADLGPHRSEPLRRRGSCPGAGPSAAWRA
jgi:nucleoside-diphosphate-sugar epimerase